MVFRFQMARFTARSQIGRRDPIATRLPFFNFAYFSHPEQEAQHSSEAQHDPFAALTAPVNPSATTPTTRMALILFMEFSPLRRKGVVVSRIALQRVESAAGAQLYVKNVR